jgi:hypothetical protein
MTEPNTALPEEVRAAIAEDPEFTAVIGRVRARIAQQEYKPELHDPHTVLERKPKEPKQESGPQRVSELLAEWEQRGERPNRYLKGAA